MKRFILFRVDKDGFLLLFKKLEDLGYSNRNMKPDNNDHEIALGICFRGNDTFTLGIYSTSVHGLKQFKKDIILIEGWKMEDVDNIININVEGNKMGLL